MASTRRSHDAGPSTKKRPQGKSRTMSITERFSALFAAHHETIARHLEHYANILHVALRDPDQEETRRKTFAVSVQLEKYAATLRASALTIRTTLKSQEGGDIQNDPSQQ